MNSFLASVMSEQFLKGHQNSKMKVENKKLTLNIVIARKIYAALGIIAKRIRYQQKNVAFTLYSRNKILEIQFKERKKNPKNS